MISINIETPNLIIRSFLDSDSKMVENQEDEDFYYRENRRIRKEQGILHGEFYHYDTPCTIDNQIDMLVKSGFKNVEMNWRVENTTIIVAQK